MLPSGFWLLPSLARDRLMQEAAQSARILYFIGLHVCLTLIRVHVKGLNER